jgi:hypothetical protein
MSPESYTLYLIGVEEVVSPFPVDTSLGIEGMTDAFGRYKVILRPMGIGLVLLSQFPRSSLALRIKFFVLSIKLPVPL